MQSNEPPIKVLITEDEILIARELEMTLQDLGYEVVGIASNGASALAQIAEVQPDLVLMDIVLPGELDGIETAEQIRQQFQLPIIFLTAYADRSTLERAKITEPFGYLLKPFQPQALNIAIQVALVRHRAESARLSNLRSSITAALPHEINTPLHGILGFTNVIQRYYDSMSKTEMLETIQCIQTSAVGLEKICKRVLLYAKLEVIGTSPPEVAQLRQMATFDSTEVIERLAQRKATELGRRMTLRLHLAELPVQMAELYLGQIVEELVDNACRFSEPGSFIDLSTTLDQQSFCLTLTDRGQGMTPNQISQIGAYQQFNRDYLEQQGLGLGLALVQQIVRLHGGSFAIQSSEQGSSITVRLPLASEIDE